MERVIIKRFCNRTITINSTVLSKKEQPFLRKKNPATPIRPLSMLMIKFKSSMFLSLMKKRYHGGHRRQFIFRGGRNFVKPFGHDSAPDENINYPSPPLKNIICPWWKRSWARLWPFNGILFILKGNAICRLYKKRTKSCP